MRKTGFLSAAACACAILAGGGLLAGCPHGVRLYSTWESLGLNLGRTRPVALDSLPPVDARPWGGTVSHHLLAGDQIDRWFSELAARRDVKRFYILSPSHWGLSTQTYSITDGTWRTRGGEVRSDRNRARELAERLGVPLEPLVFNPEHGVSTLIPYIARYFPKATVVAIAYRGEPPLDQPMAERLYKCLSPAFSEEARKENFLLISTDFSHHGDLSATRAKDLRSAGFFTAPSFSSGILVGCDNRPGIYVLSKLIGPSTKASVLFHCDSFQLSGQGSDDVTSYFFTFFW